MNKRPRAQGRGGRHKQSLPEGLAKGAASGPTVGVEQDEQDALMSGAPRYVMAAPGSRYNSEKCKESIFCARIASQVDPGRA